jgi:homoserine dehydrogenase
LLDLAARGGVPLRYEAAVLAGVPFLDTFARRGLARQISSLCGIVNGTTNFILSKMAAERWTFAAALADAQRRGYAEPDPANDIEGVDAAEKLCVLVRHFGDWRVQTSEIETEGISRIEEHDIRAAAALNGSIKPIVYADWSTGTLTAFCGPAFVPSTHPLARVNDVQNAVVLRNRMVGDLFFAGPGAGPAVTAATLLDDAAEIAASGVVDRRVRTWRRADPTTPATDWSIRIAGERLPESGTIADLLSTYGVELRATVEGRCGGREQRWHLTRPCGRARVAAASTAFSAAANCDSRFIRALAG